jgi:hypothetical protein
MSAPHLTSFRETLVRAVEDAERELAKRRRALAEYDAGGPLPSEEEGGDDSHLPYIEDYIRVHGPSPQGEIIQALYAAGRGRGNAVRDGKSAIKTAIRVHAKNARLSVNGVTQKTRVAPKTLDTDSIGLPEWK